MDESKAPTLQEIAKRADVSPSTVSRVVNGDPSVGKDVRQRVSRVLDEVSYRRRRSNGGRKPHRSRSIGLVVPDISNPFFPSIIKGVENVAKLHDYSLILCDSEGDASIERRLVETLLEKKIDGLLFIPTHETAPSVNALIDRDFPLVFLDRKIKDPRTNCVTASNEEGAFQATKYLLSLGHKKILYIGGPQDLSSETERYAGHCRALREHGVTIDQERIVRGDFSWRRTYESMADGLKKRLEDYTAIFASSDVMAFGAIQALEEKGLHVPQDVSVMGFDDVHVSALLRLTTVSQHPYEMGKGGMTLLIDVIEHRVKSPQVIELMPSMIIRGSCARQTS